MSRFNLIDEPWIPVRYPDGVRAELGIKDVLLRSKDISAIEDPSPLVVAGLHRFLLAVLYRALDGPTDIGQAKALFKEGLPVEKITTYLEKWRDRFWLFDERYPFGQIPTFEPKNWRAWTVLAAEHNADNAKVLFDHVDVEAPGAISESAATRWILATLTFSVSCGKSELSHTSTAPSATAAMAFTLGRDLLDTLLFSLVPQNREVFNDDRAMWEREPELAESLKSRVERPAFGLADRYTWRVRAIRLASSEGTIGVARLAFASALSYLGDQVDPMVGYRIDEKLGRLPTQFKERGFWRDFDSLLPDDAQLAPQAINHAASLARHDRSRFPQSVMVLGQRNDKAKIEFWRMERFELPGALAGEKSIRSDIRRLLDVAEEANKALWSGCSSFARSLLSRGDRVPHKKDVTRFVSQLTCIPVYWSALEASFHEVLQGYSLERNPDVIEAKWLTAVRTALKDAWEQHRVSVSTGDAWAIRALVKAEAPVNRKVRELAMKVREYQHEATA